MLARSRTPEITDRLHFSSEAGTFVVSSDDRGALQRLGSVLHAAFHNRALLEDHILNADRKFLPV
ncbi:Imm51 family immunity protein [Streptomyces shaanxiensis]|uniref:Uncharacterized protein n=1 Tax=Streptomyces shaanxiensis TaxID=653357 RepID=A0ABP7VS72_9ACTN